MKTLEVRVRLRAQMEGGRLVVHPRPAANVEFGHWTQSVVDRRVAAVHASNSEGMVFANDIVRAAGGPSPSRSRLEGRGPNFGGRRLQHARKS